MDNIPPGAPQSASNKRRYSVVDLTQDDGDSEEMARAKKTIQKLENEKRYLKRKVDDLTVRVEHQDATLERLAKDVPPGPEDVGGSRENEIQRLKDMIHKVVDLSKERSKCAIMETEPSKLYIFDVCGHGFSEYAIQRMFQKAVREEVKRRRIPGIVLPPEGAPFPFTPAMLNRFSRISHAIRPEYQCPLCRKKTKRPPTAYREIGSLRDEIKVITKSVSKDGLPAAEAMDVKEVDVKEADTEDSDIKEVDIEDVVFSCKIEDYFVFFRR